MAVVLEAVRQIITDLASEHKARRMAIWSGVILILAVFETVCARLYNSLGLYAQALRLALNAANTLTYVLSCWASLRGPTPALTFGYERVEVVALFVSHCLAVFACSVLLIERVWLTPGSFYPLYSVAAMVEPDEVASYVHLITNFESQTPASPRSLDDVLPLILRRVPRPSPPRAVVPIIALGAGIVDVGGVYVLWRLTTVYRGLGSERASTTGKTRRDEQRLQLRAAVVSCAAVAFASLVNDAWPTLTLLDPVAAVIVCVLTLGLATLPLREATMVLLHTAPRELLQEVTKALREASTIDGVLEFTKQHFWTVGRSKLVGHLHVRVRRDANEEVILQKINDRLGRLVSPHMLTVQIVKDVSLLGTSGSSFAAHRTAMPSATAELKTDKGPASWHGTPAGSPRRLVANGGEGGRASPPEPWTTLGNAGIIHSQLADEPGASAAAKPVLAQDTVTQAYKDADRENR